MTQVTQYHCDRCGLIEAKATLRWSWIRFKESMLIGTPIDNAGHRIELCPACEQEFKVFMRGVEK